MNLWRTITASILLIGCLLVVDVVSAAHSRRRPTFVKSAAAYDRSITTFSPDGKLAQVSYGMEAANRGDSIVAAVVGPDTALLATVVKRNKNNGPSKIYRIDDHIILATSGLAGDARALANILRGQCQQFLLNFGETPTVQQVADMAAKTQHDLTKMPGARPLGCSAIVIGINTSQTQDSEIQIYMTDPGGVMERFRYCAIGKPISIKEISECYTAEGNCSSSLEETQTIVGSLMTEDEDETVQMWTVSSDRDGGKLILAKS